MNLTEGSIFQVSGSNDATLYYLGLTQLALKADYVYFSDATIVTFLTASCINDVIYYKFLGIDDKTTSIGWFSDSFVSVLNNINEEDKTHG